MLSRRISVMITICICAGLFIGLPFWIFTTVTTNIKNVLTPKDARPNMLQQATVKLGLAKGITAEKIINFRGKDYRAYTNNNGIITCLTFI